MALTECLSGLTRYDGMVLLYFLGIDYLQLAKRGVWIT